MNAQDWADHYAGIYGVLGVEAVLVVPGSDGGTFNITVIDKIAGVELGDGVTVSSIKPAAAVRMTELSDHELTRENINDGSTITFNGKTFDVKSTAPKGSPAGEAGGEVYLVLSE